jgi:O-antigen ligase
VRRTLLVVVVFDTAFQWDKNFNYHLDAANLGALGGLTISVTTLALAGLYFMWFAELATGRASLPRGVLRPALPLVLYVGVTAASVVVATDRTLAGFEIALLAQSLLLFFYIAASVRTREDVRFVVAALAACLLLESIITLALPLTGSHKLIGIKTYAQAGSGGDSGGSRFGGTIGGPNTAGSFFALLIVPALAIAASRVSRRARRIAIAAIPLATIALILTQSRGAWVAMAVSFVFFTVVSAKRGWISPRVPIAFAVVLTLVVLPFSGTLAARVNGNDQGAARSRIPLMRIASNVISDHPLLGVGVNNVGIVFPKYAGPQFDRYWIYTVHNKYLLVWAEAGIVALGAFVWFLLATIRRGWRLWRRQDPLLSPLALGLTAGIIGQMVSMTVEIAQSRPEVQQLWLLAALLVAMENVRREEGAAPEPNADRKPRSLPRASVSAAA